jgi:hypothetical protein
MSENVTITPVNGNWLCDGIQLRPRKFVPRWFGDLLLWIFFHRLDTSTQVILSGFTEVRAALAEAKKLGVE